MLVSLFAVGSVVGTKVGAADGLDGGNLVDIEVRIGE
jgi:hypothetical protein